MGNLPSQLRSASAEGDVAKIIALCTQAPGLANNSADQDGWTPLHYAALKGHVAAAKELLQLGANVNQQNKDGSSALHIASLRGHGPIIQLLLQQSSIALDARDGQGSGRMTPLHKAAAAGHVDVCKLLLNAGADPNARTITGGTPAHLAAARGKLPPLEVLLMAGTQVDSQDLDLRSPLHEAAAGGHLQCALLLLAHGANARARDKDGFTPGQLALAAKHMDVVNMIEPNATLPSTAAAPATPAQAPSGTPAGSGGRIRPINQQPDAARMGASAQPYQGGWSASATPPPPPPPQATAGGGRDTGYPNFPGEPGFLQGPVGLGEQYAYPALVSGTNLRYTPPSAPPMEPNDVGPGPSATPSQYSAAGSDRPHWNQPPYTQAAPALDGVHNVAVPHNGQRNGSRPNSRPGSAQGTNRASGGAPGPAAAVSPRTGTGAARPPRGDGDAEWSEVADVEEDAEGGWGLGPREAAALAREQAERQAKHKGAGHLLGAAGRHVWGLIQGAGGGTDRHKDDDDFDEDEYDEARSEAEKQQRKKEQSTPVSSEDVAFAAQRMAALEAQISRRNGWIRGADLAGGPQGVPGSATPSEALRVYQQQMEIQFLKQQLEALQLQQSRQPHQATAQQYTYCELYEATGGFPVAACIGTGGFGRVYRGVLHHTPVAIKVLNPDAVQGAAQFKAEVDILSRVRHPHIVLLLGCCPEANCLVYELMDNGSLEDFLKDIHKLSALTWAHRVKILLDTASALLALHTLRPDPILHRDVKPSNILLDASFSAKLADVGLARIAPELAPAAGIAGAATSTIMDPSPMGTLMYTDPVYLQTGQYGPKSDVYSLGMTMLQIVCGKLEPLLQQAEQAVSAGQVHSVLDGRMDGLVRQDAKALVLLALRCCNYARAQRPDLEKEVLPALTQMYQSAMAALYSAKGSPRGGPAQVTEPPPMFVCPITQEIMEWPVVCADGYTYEESAIARWLQNHNTSPLTNVLLAHKQLLPNHVLRSAIVEWKEAHPGQC